MTPELSAGVRNHTQVVEFVLLGFSGIPNGHLYLFPPFLAIYSVTVLGNLMIFTLIRLDAGLQTPMYYFLSHLSFLDICVSSVTVPKILVNVLRRRQTISYNECMAQLFFFLSFSGTEALLLGAMAFDRYAAICKPLHYSRLMNPKVCFLLASAAWVGGFLDSALHTSLSSKLDFCGANRIEHIFCDLSPLIAISCGDRGINEMAILVTSLFVGMAPFLLTVLSYVFILSSILQIHSTSGKRKAFSTCASHLTIVVIYYGNGLLNYDRPSSGYSLEVDTLTSTMFCIVPPVLNPLIYSLRNKEVKGALRKLLESQSKSACHHHARN